MNKDPNIRFKKMRKFFYILIFFSLKLFGQNLYLKINGTTTLETKKIDSITYVKKHLNGKSIVGEVNLLANKLQKNGFLETKILETKQVNDSVFMYGFELGRRTEFMHIYIGLKNKDLVDSKTDSLVIPFYESEVFLNGILKKLESKGFSMSKLKLTNLKTKKNFVIANLDIVMDKKRQLNDIVVNGYDKFSLGHKRNLKRLYRNKIFNQQNLEKLYKDVEQFRFVKQTKYPEILFTKDSTKVFIYLEKAKINTFDGFVGFTNDDNKKLIFTGYIDLVLNNILNSGERLSLLWRSNGKAQRIFDIGVEIPYVFKTPIGLKAKLNLTKQDSTFQTTQTNIDLGYYFNYNTRLYLGYQSSESSDIKKVNSSLISDFTNEFVTANFEFVNFKSESFLFPEKTSVSFKLGTGKRNSKFQDNSQFFGSLTLKHDFYLNDKNIINLKSQNFYLQSDTYIANELYRFGGINSIRGFNENSLQGNLFTSILSEYRYVLSPSLYINSIIDYAFFQDKTINKSDTLLGIGFGFGLLTKNGLFNFVYANGSTKNQAIQFSNSIVQVSLKAVF